MRKYVAALLLGTASAAAANSTPDIVPAPAWVKRVPVKVPTDTTEAPVRVLLSDQQVSLAPGSIARFGETAILIQSAAGLSVGNIAIPWRPDVDTIAVHALSIIRNGKVIDVLAKQKFTVIRRETNLEDAALDGRLTATMIVEGVEVGDVIDFASSIVSRDPTLGNHVESVLAEWNGVPIERAHARLHWTNDVPLRLQPSAGLPAFSTASDSTGKFIELNAEHVQPIIPAKGAPLRFRLGRIIQATDYRGWNDLSARFEPLFAKASTIDPKGVLAQRIATIRAENANPLARAAAALRLVEDNVRYVALFMGEGGYVPAQADATWANRLGDCKAKTALLLAMLHGLDIAAVPVLVSSRAGDGIDTRLPMVESFDHVLVRATIQGRDYWLDGTRSGDRDLAQLDTPKFHWGLPLVREAKLVRMVPAPHAEPDTEFTLNIDAREGLYAPAKAHAEVIYRRDAAQAVKLGLAALPDASRDNALNEFWRGTYDFIEPTKVAAAFDPATGAERLTVDGTARLKVNDSWLRVPGSNLAYTADFSRPAGPNQDAPFATNFPNFERAATTIRLPAGVSLWPGQIGHDVDQTLAGVAYHREAKLADNVLTMVRSERATVPEVDAAAARAAQARLRALNDEDVQLTTGGYNGTDADLAALNARTPDTAEDYVTRGLLRLDHQKYAEAIADFTAANGLRPKDEWVLANRGIAHAWLDQPGPAEADFAAAAAINPSNPVVARGRALVAARKGDGKAAIAQLTASLQVEPKNSFALRQRAEINRSLGNYDAAIADTDTLLGVRPTDTDVRLLRANIFKGKGLNDRAVAEAEALQRLNPHDNYAQVTAGKIYAATGHKDRALAALDAALAIKPEAFVYLNRADVRPKTDFAGRKADIEAALKLDPKQEDAMLFKARLQSDEHDYRGAIATFTALLATDPKNPYALVDRAIAESRIGDNEAARRDLLAQSGGVMDATAYNNLCWTKATNDVALASALDDCNHALKSQPANAGFLDSRGFVNLRLGNLDAAIADFSAALKISPTLPASLYGRSVAYARKGNQAAAATDLKEAERFSPDIVETYRGYGIEPVRPAPSKTASATH